MCVSWKDWKCQYKLLLKTLIELEFLNFRGKPPKFACRYRTRAVALSSPRITWCIKTQARTPRFLQTNFDTKLVLKLLLTASVTCYSIGNTVNFSNSSLSLLHKLSHNYRILRRTDFWDAAYSAVTAKLIVFSHSIYPNI